VEQYRTPHQRFVLRAFPGRILSLNNNRDRSHVEFGIGAGIGAKGEHFWKAVAKKFIVVADGAEDPF
jgi:hypothetical protein